MLVKVGNATNEVLQNMKKRATEGVKKRFCIPLQTFTSSKGGPRGGRRARIVLSPKRGAHNV